MKTGLATLFCIFCLTSCTPESTAQKRQSVALLSHSDTASAATPIAGPISGEYLCRVRELPHALPEYVFRCTAAQNKDKTITLRSLEDRETKLRISPSSGQLFEIKGLVYIKERHLGKRYSPKWVHLKKGILHPATSPNATWEGSGKAIVQGYGEWAKPNRVDFRTGRSTTRGTKTKIAFSLSR